MAELHSPLDHFSALFAEATFAGAPLWLAPMQSAAHSRLVEMGFPARDNEEWRFTDIRPLLAHRFAPAPQGIVDANSYQFDDSHTLVFVNGRFRPELSQVDSQSLPSGAVVTNLADALVNHASLLESHLGRYADFQAQPFTALNTAFLEEGAFVYLPKSAVVEKPIHLLFLSSGSEQPFATQARTLIVAEENSRAQVVESYAGPAGAVYFTNAVTEVALAPYALVDHYKLQRESVSAYHIATMAVNLKRDANFSSHSMTFGGAIARNEVSALLGGEHIECTLNGLYLADGDRLVDNHTAIDHAMPNCNSHEIYKGILDGRSRGVFNGKIYVREDAQKTDAKQTNRTLLLSDEAQILTKPQLEIFADDVKCTHGATVGQLDAGQLFYLRSRGLPISEARALLIYAFAGDIVNRIKVPAVREALDAVLLALLPKG